MLNFHYLKKSLIVTKFILKKNVQRKKGIKLTSDLEEVKNANTRVNMLWFKKNATV